MLVVSVACVFALAGCGDTEIDSDKVEEFVLEETRVPEAVDTVTCPDDVKAEEGDTFECTIVAKDGSEESVSIRQEDDDGTVTITGNRQTKLPPDTSDLTIIPENVEALIRGAADPDLTIVSVDCPSGIELEKGDTFECLVRFDDRSEERVRIVQRDELGNVEITGSKLVE